MSYTSKYGNIDNGCITRADMTKDLIEATGCSEEDATVFLKALEHMYEKYLLETKIVPICCGVKLVPYVLREQIIQSNLCKILKSVDMPETIIVPPRKSYKLKMSNGIRDLWNGAYGRNFFEIQVSDKYIEKLKKNEEKEE